jgi:hypothetical protein
MARDAHVLDRVPTLYKPIARLAERWESEMPHLALRFGESRV